ncbi:hypothetical protein SOVF_158960, partial [Spinacia oleracea]
MKSNPKAIALGVVILEIIVCILIYFGCACIRRWRHHHHRHHQHQHQQQHQQQHSQQRTISVSSDDSNISSRPTLESILVFFPYSLAKALLGKEVTSLNCANCLDEFKEGNETLRLIPKCGHVFHPMCLADPCSATCPYCRDRSELVGFKDESKAEAEAGNKVDEVLEIIED